VSGQGIEQLDGNLDIGLGEDGRLDIDLDGANLIAGGMRFETLARFGHRQHAQPPIDRQHHRRAARPGTGPGGRAGRRGRLHRSARGRLSLATEEFGTWALQRPAELAFADGAAKLGPLCIGNGQNSGGCVSFDQPRAGLFEASLDVERIGFEILNPVLPELLVMEGFAAPRVVSEGRAPARR
jgi:translocation and assembly module TamB